jgi:hypothetical protein
VATLLPVPKLVYWRVELLIRPDILSVIYKARIKQKRFKNNKPIYWSVILWRGRRYGECIGWPLSGLEDTPLSLGCQVDGSRMKGEFCNTHTHTHTHTRDGVAFLKSALHTALRAKAAAISLSLSHRAYQHLCFTELHLLYRSRNFIGNHRWKITSSIIISSGITRRTTDVYNFQVLSSIINFTSHLLKDQAEDGPTTGPKHVAAIII